MTIGTPCAGCPSPILAGAPRVERPTKPWYRSGVRVDAYHPGCWAAEQRRTVRG